MKSFFDPCYREKDCVPVAYSWYDRADMMKTTLEAVNHSHSLCEIMYVCEGGMSIETDHDIKEGDIIECCVMEEVKP